MTSMEKIKQMLTVNEVSQILHIHSNTVRRWANQGILRTYRVNSRGDRRFVREDIDRFLAKFNSKNN
jgi:excisionase family DNA binding protein